jgi:hypothetical protein
MFFFQEGGFRVRNLYQISYFSHLLFQLLMGFVGLNKNLLIPIGQNVTSIFLFVLFHLFKNSRNTGLPSKFKAVSFLLLYLFLYCAKYSGRANTIVDAWTFVSGNKILSSSFLHNSKFPQID